MTKSRMLTFMMCAVMASGLYACSGSDQSGNLANLPVAPENLVASPGNNQVTLSWNSSRKERSYNIYREVLPRAVDTGVPYATGITTTSYRDANAVSGETYQYMVTAVNEKGESGASTMVTVKPEELLGGSLTTGGIGSHITLVNGTPYDWIKTDEPKAYQMNNTWVFPSTIPAGGSTTKYFEFEHGLFVTLSDDAGETTYTLKGTDKSFVIKARAPNGNPSLQVVLNFETLENAKGAVMDLAWEHNGYSEFILSGNAANPSVFTTNDNNNNKRDWMQANRATLGTMTLGQLAIPGTHDAGMSVLPLNTVGSNGCNTVTQTTGILGQLQFGVRYFDIRPVRISPPPLSWTNSILVIFNKKRTWGG